MMESIEKLREKIKRDVNNPWDDLQGALLVKVDEIEREIAEKYMELPLDADGVPIRIGDSLECMESSGEIERFVVAGYTTEYSTWTGDDVPLMATNENATEFYCRNCHHVKPRTVEDVLMNAGVSVAAISDVAAEIRELLGSDA